MLGLTIAIGALLSAPGAPGAQTDDWRARLQWAQDHDPNDHIITGHDAGIVWGGIRDWTRPRWRHTAVWWDEQGRLRYVLPGEFEHDGYRWRLTMTRSIDRRNAAFITEAECVEWVEWLARTGGRPGGRWDGPREATFAVTKGALADRTADFDRNGVVDIADYIAFVRAWVDQNAGDRGDPGNSDATAPDPKDRPRRLDPD